MSVFMYRYTSAKNQRANKKLLQKQLKKKVPVATAKKSSQAKAGPRRVKKTVTRKSPSKSVAQTRKKSWFWSNFVAVTVSLCLFLVLCYLMIVLCLKFFLPQFFAFSAERNILLIGGAPEEKAKNIYILRLSPANETVKVFTLDSQTLVPVSGGYGDYPLGFVAPLLQLEASNTQELVAVYNFALKQAIDEVYFLPSLHEPLDETAVVRDFWSLIKRELSLTTNVRRQLWEIFFYLQRETSFTKGKLAIAGDAGVTAQFLAKEKITQCPAVLINTTNINGLAAKASQMAEMNGVVVVNLESSSEDLWENEVYYDQNEPDCLKLVQVLQNSFPQLGKLVPDNGTLAAQNRAKAVIKLGRSLSD
ncbi:MAG: hypothetical protein Q4G02_02620 [bacterium]|nr:hypothetical protein [bacterium]